MAWELDRDMHSWVAPSIAAHAQSLKSGLRKAWLANVYASQICEAEGRIFSDPADKERFDRLNAEGLRMPELSIIEAIADRAIARGETSDGGHEIFLTSTHRVRWCSEDDHLLFYL